jgi:hypothetical protein
MGATLSPLIIAAAVATAGFWTYQLIWSGPETVSADTAAIREEAQRQAQAAADAEAKLTAAEAEQQRLNEAVQRQAKTAADSDAKLKASQTEQQRLKDEVQRQIKAVADADSTRKTAEAEQQRLKDEVQRLTKAAADVEAKLKSSEAEQQRLRDEVQRLTKPKGAQEFSGFLAGHPADSPASSTALFTIRTNTSAMGYQPHEQSFARSIGDCEQKCAQTATCKIFSYGKGSGICYTYSRANLVPNESFDSGVRK